MSSKNVFGTDSKTKYEGPFKVLTVPAYFQWYVTISNLEKKHSSIIYIPSVVGMYVWPVWYAC